MDGTVAAVVIGKTGRASISVRTRLRLVEIRNAGEDAVVLTKILVDAKIVCVLVQVGRAVVDVVVAVGENRVGKREIRLGVSRGNRVNLVRRNDIAGKGRWVYPPLPFGVSVRPNSDAVNVVTFWSTPSSCVAW